MFQSIRRSWELTKYSWAFLLRNKTFMIFPVLSGVAMLAVTLVLLLPAAVVTGVLAAATGQFGDAPSQSSDIMSGQIIGLVLLFLYYLVVYTISIYFNVALTGAVLREMDGHESNVREGLSIANGKLGLIVQYAALSATVGVILSAIRERAGWLGDLIAGLGGLAWNLVTFFVVPLLVIENKGVIDLVKDSGALLRRTFGEQIVGGAGVGLVFGALTFLLVIVGGGLLMLFSGSTVMIVLVIAVLVVLFVLLGLVSSTLSAIYSVALFHYAQTGSAPQDLDPSLLQAAFHPRGAR